MVCFVRNLDILVLVYEFLQQRTNGGQNTMCTPPFAVYSRSSEAQEKSIPSSFDDGTAVRRPLMLQSVGIALLAVRNNAGRNFPDGLNLTSVT